MDWGYRNPCAWYLCGIDYDGRLFIHGEHYRAEWKPKDHVTIMKPRIEEREIRLNLADPAAWQVERDGISPADEFLRLGVPLDKAENERVGSIMAVKRMFEADTIAIHPSCVELLRETPAYRWQKLTPTRAEYLNLPEDAVKKDDHAIDAALRYPANYALAGGYVEVKGKTPEELLEDQIKALSERREEWEI